MEDIKIVDKSWTATRSGLKINPSTMVKEDILIEDIAWALSHLCRYNGHCDHFYSVAQHSVYVSNVVEGLGGDPKKGLLHDATECYIGDMVRPVKQRPEMEGFVILEDRIMDLVGEAFNLGNPVVTPIIKLADNIVLHSEKDQIFENSPDWGWGDDLPRMKKKIELMYPPEAYKFFMERYNELFS